MHSTNINKNAPLLTHTMRTTLEHLASVSSKQDLSWCKLVPHSFPTITNTRHALCCYCFLHTTGPLQNSGLNTVAALTYQET